MVEAQTPTTECFPHPGLLEAFLLDVVSEPMKECL